jgi:hypothetical protein
MLWKKKRELKAALYGTQRRAEAARQRKHTVKE